MLTTIVPVAIGCELRGGTALNSKERSSYHSPLMFTSTPQTRTENAKSKDVDKQERGTSREEEENDNDDLVSEQMRVAESAQSAKSISQMAYNKSGYLFASKR
jgi:hypothetical protein